MTRQELERVIAEVREDPPQPPEGSAVTGWRRLQSDLAVGVAPAFDLSPPPVIETVAIAKTGASVGVIGKIVATVAIVGGTSTVVSVTRSHVDAAFVSNDVSAVTAAQQPRVLPPAPVGRPQVPIDSAVVPMMEPNPIELAPQLDPAVRPTESARPRRAKRPRSTDLEQEARLVSSAQRALGEGRPTRALDLLDEHQHRHPNGAMSEDREALRLLALCRADRIDDLENRRKQFFRRWPKSLHAGRLRAACQP